MPKLNNVAYIMLFEKLLEFLAPYAMPETVISEIPTAMQGKNASDMIFQAIVKE